MLLENPQFPNEELVVLLPRRSEGAIQAVRAGIDAFRTGRDHSMLSKMMVRVLEERQPH